MHKKEVKKNLYPIAMSIATPKIWKSKIFEQLLKHILRVFPSLGGRGGGFNSVVLDHSGYQPFKCAVYRVVITTGGEQLQLVSAIIELHSYIHAVLKAFLELLPPTLLNNGGLTLQ